MAASVFGEAARAIDLDPRSLAPALAERETAPDEHELAYVELSVELSAVTPGRAGATGSAATPFDADVDGPSATPELSATPEPSVASESSAPFDFEAELDSVRAA
jgi:hypothetical protein